MKKIHLSCLFLSLFLLVSCNNSSNTNSSDTNTNTGTNTNTTSPSTGTSTGGDDLPIYEQGEQKDVNGTGLLFKESLGFNTKDASVFDENGERYVIYASQEEAKGKQVFAARKGVNNNGEWEYGEKHIVFRGSENSWDNYIYQPSIVKGTFSYQQESYSYLLAYQGNEYGDNYNNHIGLAVSNNIFGEWVRVGNTPILENPEIFEASFGYGSPVLNSIDKQGKVMLTYAFGETQISGVRVKQCDFSNLNEIIVEEGYAELPSEGLIGRDDGILSNVGLAIKDNENHDIILANDGAPSLNIPGCASSFEIAIASSDILSSTLAKWTSIKKVTGFDTMDMNNDESLGWDELYSPEIVTNEYGYISSDATSIEVIYSTFNEGVMDSNYTASLCSIEVNLGE